MTETSFSDNDLRENNYTYSVEAVYDDNSVSLRDGIDFYLPVYRHIDATVAPDTTWGLVEGTGFYADGDTVELKATPATGYSFLRWNDGSDIVSREAPYRFAARYDLTLTATFRKGVANERTHTATPLTVYPNPTDDLLYIEHLPDGLHDGGVFDLQGRLLIPLHLQGGTTLNVPVARLTKGAYIVKLTAADGAVRMAKFQKL